MNTEISPAAMWGIIVLAVVGVLVAGFFYIRQGSQGLSPQEEQTLRQTTERQYMEYWYSKDRQRR